MTSTGGSPNPLCIPARMTINGKLTFASLSFYFCLPPRLFGGLEDYMSEGTSKSLAWYLSSNNRWKKQRLREVNLPKLKLASCGARRP